MASKQGDVSSFFDDSCITREKIDIRIIFKFQPSMT